MSRSTQLTARVKLRFTSLLQHLCGQIAFAASVGLICFLFMYAIVAYLSEQLPSGSQIHQKTGIYLKKTWVRGSSSSSLGTDPLFCVATAFRFGYCSFESNGKTVTASLSKFPRLWGDIDVVLEAKSDTEVLSSSGLEIKKALWKEDSLVDCFKYAAAIFLFSFLGIRHLNRKFYKE